MAEISEIKQKIEKRLEYVNNEIAYVNGDLGNVCKYHHYRGYLQGLDGTFGEKQFLTKLLDFIEKGDVHEYKF